MLVNRWTCDVTERPVRYAPPSLWSRKQQTIWCNLDIRTLSRLSELSTLDVASARLHVDVQFMCGRTDGRSSCMLWPDTNPGCMLSYRESPPVVLLRTRLADLRDVTYLAAVTGHLISSRPSNGIWCYLKAEIESIATPCARGFLSLASWLDVW